MINLRFRLSLVQTILLLVGIGILIYSKTLFNGFVWDDNPHILENPLVKFFKVGEIFTRAAVFPNSDSFLDAYYKPLMSFVFALIYKVFHENPSGYHLFQVLLHLFNSILLLVLLKRFFKVSLSLFLSLVFLVHPINFESVGYVSALQDTMFLFFGLIFFKLLMDDDEKRDWSYSRYSLVGIMFFFSILSKETGFIFALISAVYLILFKPVRLRIYFLTISIFSLFYLLFRFVAVQNRYGYLNESKVMSVSIYERLISFPSIILYYLKTFFLPKDLFIDQQWIINKATLANFYLPLLFLIVVLVLIYYFVSKLYRENRKDFNLFIFFVAWTVIGIFVHSHLVISLDMTVADRWFYFPIVGVLGILGIVIKNVRVEILNRRFRLLFVLVGILVIVALAARTVMRSLDWKDNLTLYSHDLKYSQNNYSLENKYGASLLKANDLINGEIHIRKALLYNPNYAPAYVNLGYVFEKSGDFEKAKEFYGKSIEINDRSSVLVLNKALGAIARIELFQNNNALKAKELSEKGLREFGQDSYLMYILSISEYSLGNKSTALDIINKAYKLDSSDEILKVKLGIEKDLPLKLEKS